MPRSFCPTEQQGRGGILNVRMKPLGITALAMVWVMALIGTALAATPTHTNWIQAGSSSRGTISGAVGVCEIDQQECGEIDGTMKVKLFKRKDGAWVKIDAKQATKESGNLWSVEFTGAPKAGTCKMLGIYSGSETFDPSRDPIKGGCTDSNWPL